MKSLSDELWFQYFAPKSYQSEHYRLFLYDWNASRSQQSFLGSRCGQFRTRHLAMMLQNCRKGTVLSRDFQCPTQEESDKDSSKTPNRRLRPLRTPIRAVCQLYLNETPTVRIVRMDNVDHIDQEIDRN